MNQNHDAQTLVEPRLHSVWYAARVHEHIRPSDQPKWHNIDDCQIASPFFDVFECRVSKEYGHNVSCEVKRYKKQIEAREHGVSSQELR